MSPSGPETNVVAYSKSGGIEGAEDAIDKFRRKLKERGGTGILGLGRQFRVYFRRKFFDFKFF